MLVLAPAAAAAPRSSGLLLTLAARQCPTYTAITANKARNNIMESLRNLGADTPYKSGEIVDPEVEERVQPECSPLPDWSFTLGSSYATKAVTGPWGALSIVKGQLREPLVTKAETPLLNSLGEPTGQNIAGAVTFELGPKEAQLSPSGSLWVQGGTPTDPILNEQFPGPAFGFGALRCATDNVNGDNVEYVRYPAGDTHVFCFAYYVVPPPTSGTIVIRKRAVGDGAPRETFHFDGNVSYNPGGQFTLSPPAGGEASETFFRGATGQGHGPWVVRETGVPDWKLTDLTCDSKQGTSETTTSLADGTASIDLGPEDTVVCTYTDEYSPPPQGLLIRKVTAGGTGRFEFSVTPADGGEATKAVATTAAEGLAVDADPAPLDLAPGRYRIVEQEPEGGTGGWKLEAVECGGKKVDVEDGAVVVEVSARAVETCTFHNQFVGAGAITLSKETRGAVGTTGFEIAPVANPEMTLRQTATTRSEGEPVEAHGDPSGHLALGRYTITESPGAPGTGEWELAEVECDGRVVPFAEGRIEVELTQGDPHLHCNFLNVFHRKAEPPQSTTPTAEEPSNLEVEKRLLTAHPEAGVVIEYEITVRNTGPGAAFDASATDQPLGSARLVFARPSSGSCLEGLPLRCNLGTIPAGGSETVRVGIISADPGKLVNLAIAGSAGPDRGVLGAEAEAPAKVRPSRVSEPTVPGLG